MTSRMHAPHTTCPGCQEEVFLDELVGGKCPLCGCPLEDFEGEVGEYEAVLDRSDLSWLVFNYFIFKKFTGLGVPPTRILELVAAYEENSEKPPGEWKRTDFSFEIPMNAWDRVRPKRCGTCRKIFFRHGKKYIRGDIRHADVRVQYVCERC